LYADDDDQGKRKKLIMQKREHKISEMLFLSKQGWGGIKQKDAALEVQTVSLSQAGLWVQM
jgi:hypothetical protein